MQLGKNIHNKLLYIYILYTAYSPSLEVLINRKLKKHYINLKFNIDQTHKYL